MVIGKQEQDVGPLGIFRLHRNAKQKCSKDCEYLKLHGVGFS
ncbi:MAG: hypothetical protein CM1200mP29_16920 [Verrucomicrobiota bacterium]|nr:MAG: hypothetical protein CM1200mP29_16920 [Verrucomicrobiota bacterium]